ncbi:hypothetical protein GCM10027028_60720 [Streptomyces sundarbansensis]
MRKHLPPSPPPRRHKPLSRPQRPRKGRTTHRRLQQPQRGCWSLGYYGLDTTGALPTVSPAQATKPAGQLPPSLAILPSLFGPSVQSLPITAGQKACDRLKRD